MGWHWGFGLAALGMTVAVVQFRLGSKHLGLACVATIPAEVKHRAIKQLFLAILICTILAVAGFSGSKFFDISVTSQDLADFMGYFLFSYLRQFLFGSLSDLHDTLAVTTDGQGVSSVSTSTS